MFDFKSIALWTFAIFSLSTAVFGKLPPYIKACKADANLESCVLAQQEQVIARLSNGDPMNKIHSFNPMEVHELTVLDNGASRSVAMNITFRDMKIWGLPDGRLTNFWLNKTEKRIRWKIDLPKGLKILSKYKVGGKILVLPLQGDGDIEVLMGGAKLEFSILYDEVKKGKKKVMFIKSTELTHDLDSMKIRMDNLFNGDKALGDNLNLVMNDNWQEMNRQIGPSITKALGLASKPLLDRFVSGATIEEIFPQ
ncbi:Hypothetical protein NTJ_14743 [Nesidiocoris tenuis]|uniref:Protein takeout n=1 Tax=Nesidiocoris tenuis TaxID=355587 RepID=A0ABN7BE42_9HEMI|nr:Hypothetical protein NTJ_14743 [Nesidiocoris tenuis]